MRGGKPLPTVVKQRRGTLRPDRVRADEPQPAVLAADPFDTPPAELEADPIACAEWTRLAPVLRAARQVTEADRPALVAVCLEWSRYLRAYRLADVDGLVTKRGSGGIGISAYAVTAHRSLQALTRLWSELGLTPASRTRLGVVSTAPFEDAFSQFDDPEPFEPRAPQH